MVRESAGGCAPIAEEDAQVGRAEADVPRLRAVGAHGVFRAGEQLLQVASQTLLQPDKGRRRAVFAGAQEQPVGGLYFLSLL